MSLLLACAGGDPTEPGTPGSGGDDSRPNPNQAMEVAGDYQVSSHFDISVGDLGEELALFGLLEDIAQNPWGAVSDRLADAAGIGFLAPIAENILRDNISPSIEADIANFATSFLEFSGEFDVVSELAVSGDEGSMSASHRTVGMNVTIDGRQYEWAFDDEPAVTAGASRSGDRVTFEAHSLVVPYSQMLVAAVDIAIVPALDPSADNLGDALSTLVDCDGIGDELDGTLSLSASTYTGFCEIAMDQVAAEIYDYVAEIADLSVEVQLAGAANMSDENQDGAADQVSGSWVGEFAIGSYGNFKGDAAFTGSRMSR